MLFRSSRDTPRNNMNETATDNNWFQKTLKKLLSDGFVVTHNVTCDQRTFKAVARRTRFELTKCGFAETFFIFEEFDSPTEDAIRKFSSDAFGFAKRSKSIPLPCGLGESVFCFPIAAAKSVEDLVAHSVRTEAPPKHWAAAEIPVVVDETKQRLCYFERTPLWGAAYHRGFRTQIERYLGES